MAAKERVHREREDEGEVDACDLDFTEADATPDAGLPAAAGGVERHTDDQSITDEVDGCDLDFNQTTATGDEGLPVAVGGVA